MHNSVDFDMHTGLNLDADCVSFLEQTKLETKLSSLYKELIHLHSIMETETNNDSAYLWTSCHVTTAARERLMTQILKSCAMMKDCSADLLDLSMLFPSAPWVLCILTI